MSLVKSKIKAMQPNQNTQTIFGILAANKNIQLGTESRSLLGRAFLTLESFSEGDRRDADTAADQLDDATTEIKTAYEAETEQQLSDDQVKNIRESLIAAQDPDAYSKGVAQRDAETLVSPLGGEADIGEVVGGDVSTESFEVHGMMNTLAMTVSYNINPTKQTPAVELFFPTITMDSTQNNYTIDVQLSTVFVSKEYTVDGKRDAYRNQKNIVKALRDHTILKSHFTDIVPVYRKNTNDQFFVDTTKLAPYTKTTDYGETIQTSLLAVGKEIMLLDIAQPDRMLSRGMQDDTDQISANPFLKTLGLELDNEVVLFSNLQFHQQSQWTYMPSGDREGIQLQYDVSTHMLTKDTKGANSQALPTSLNVLTTNNWEVLLRVQVNGTGNTDTGTVQVNTANVTVKAVRKADTHEELSLEDASVKAFVADIESKMKIVGYELDATRTNANLREHGQLLDSRVQRLIYGVRLHSPLAIRRPKDDADTTSDSQRIDTLIKWSFIRRSNAGITALYDVIHMLQSQPKNLSFVEPFNKSVIGVGQWFANTYCSDLTLDVKKAVQSLQTSDRLNNVNSVFANFILVEMTKAYCQSELAAAYELSDIASGGFKPHVIAIADTFTSKFIYRDGDDRVLGSGFDFTLEECTDKRLTDGGKDGEEGTIFLSFGKPKSGNISLPLWFGNCLDKREIPRVVSRARGDKYQHEVMVQPWFTHIVHLPILVRIRVINLASAVAERMPFVVQQ